MVAGGVCGGRGGMCDGRGVKHGGGGWACMVAGGHAWWQGGHAWWWGVCMVVGGVHGWGVHGREGHAWDYDEIRSMSGPYASYWNAFLLIYNNNILYISAKA